MRLVEPLVESCDWLSSIAELTCLTGTAITWSQDRGGAAPDHSCAWYHGNWQYLRLLDLVSNPANHTAFYHDALRGGAGHLPRADVAICGAADYSMLAHVCAALGATVRPVVVDLCRTPLIANDWYARRAGTAVPDLVQADACVALPAGRYDVVITDSFLPRVERANLPPTLRTWRSALRSGGAVVTTVRIADPDEDNRQPFVDHFAQSVRRAAPWLPTVTRRTADELAERLTAWVRRQEAGAFLSVEEAAEPFAAAGFGKVDAAERHVGHKRYAEIVAHR